MKKLFTIMIACAILLTVMTACSSHSHTETGNWLADATGHWKLCEGCDEKLQTGDHTMNDEFRCTVCGSEIIDWGDSVSVQIYDEHDNIIRMTDYDADGNLISETVNEYEYDANGNLTKDKQYIDGQLSGETEYTVTDGESVPAKYTYYYEDGGKFVNEYDSNGNIIKLTEYDADGNVDMQIISEYAQNSDGEWYESACTETYSDGMKIEAEYNEYDDATSRVIYENDTITSTESWEYTYDDNGFTATEKAYVDGALYQEIIYKTVTEDDGMFNYAETVTTYDNDGGKRVCVYDENYELVSETEYDADGNVIE